MDKEIVKACIKYKNKLFTGFDHGECFDRLLKEEQPKDMTELEQGFIDNELNFVDRKSAMEIASIAGQLKFKPVKEILISEDLHLAWLNRQAKQIADIEAKLAEAQKTIEIQRMASNALMEENLEYRWDITESAYEYAKNIAKGWESQYQEEIDQLKQQLAEKDSEVQSWKDGTMVVKLGKLEEQLAEERKKVVQEIRDLAGDYFEMPYCDACGNTDFNDVVLIGRDLTEILDDVERGE